MRVKVAYTVDVNDEFRRALVRWYGDASGRLATAEEIAAHYRAWGSREDDSVRAEYAAWLAAGGEP